MTEKMAESLGMNDLDRVKKALKILHEKENESEEEFNEEEVENALQEYRNLDQALMIDEDPEFDSEMNEIAKESHEAFKDLFDLGLSVETKYTAEIVSAAERFKNTQLSALKIKVERKLKAIDLRLKERRLDLLEKKQNSEIGQRTVDGDGEYIDDDRDSILEDD